MKRITYVEIAGKNCPLLFSLGAAKKMADKFGSLEKAFSGISSAKETTGTVIDAIIFTLVTMNDQALQYLRIFENEEGERINEEALYASLTVNEIARLASAISTCLEASQKKEIETKANPKNADAPEVI